MTVRVTVANVINLPNDASFFEVFSDLFIDFPHVCTYPVAFGKVTVLINRVHNRNFILFRKRKVLFAIRGSNMHNARTVFVADIIRGPHFVRIFTTALTKQRLI